MTASSCWHSSVSYSTYSSVSLSPPPIGFLFRLFSKWHPFPFWDTNQWLFFCVTSLSSGIPVQLDRLLHVFLSDHFSSRPLWGHLRLWPLADQMDPHCQGKHTHTPLCSGWFVLLSKAAAGLFLNPTMEGRIYSKQSLCVSVGSAVLHILPWLLWWTVLAMVGLPGVG